MNMEILNFVGNLSENKQTKNKDGNCINASANQNIFILKKGRKIVYLNLHK